MADRDTLLKMLDLARWAPSGDNTQPWRFEIVSESHIAIHGHDTRDWCVYDFRGYASHIAHGALLETLRIAASDAGLIATWALRDGTTDVAPIYDVTLEPSADIAPDPLLAFVESRAVQRRPMQTTPLTGEQKAALKHAVGDDFELSFFESGQMKRRVAKLLWDSAYLRLTCPEAYEVHKRVIEWGARFSDDKIPEEAVGVDAATAKLMRWVMQSWARVAFFNKYLAGTIAPRIQLDVLPALRCAAHILITPKSTPAGFLDYVRAGQSMQRLWLTTASLGLHLQPEMTPVIFRWYAQNGVPITADRSMDAASTHLAGQFDVLANRGTDDPFVFFCRVGTGANPVSRSLRIALRTLLRSD
ncbi:MAG: molybdopterin biosynthesis protein MoeY [Denitromonas halophila]|nr:MAG: molybdopterin biosynthesis protein MoeY [Denitromonas halophila]TVT73271.1 MAG: molybdopterin biosynthesis protein MoeY [Denitromonas halophila]TVT77405.1 MAG: molybdopterin biosynthesis protein MoeY [Denitromonas halophila]